MEEVVRQQLRKSNTRNLTLSGGKHALFSKIASDEDVQFHWSIVAADFGEAEEKILLDMIIDLWVTIQGFSFVSVVMCIVVEIQISNKKVWRS